VSTLRTRVDAKRTFLDESKGNESEGIPPEQDESSEIPGDRKGSSALVEDIRLAEGRGGAKEKLAHEQIYQTRI